MDKHCFYFLLGLRTYFVFTVYSTSPLGDIVRFHGMCFHFYADDMQIYLSFESSSTVDKLSAVSCIEACISDINKWMLCNKLKLNNSKTEVLVIGARHRPHPQLDLLLVGDEHVVPTSSARNLGTVFDENMTLESHVTAICKSAFFRIRNIARIKRYLSQANIKTLIHAFVTCKLDHCNSLLIGLPCYLIKRLQMVQNCAARLVVGGRKYDPVTSVLCQLHWLPVEQRILYKILLLTYKALNGLAPLYLCDMLERYIPVRRLRSSDNYLLSIPWYNLKSYGGRAFSIVAPKLWNN